MPASINAGFVAARRAGVCVQLGMVPDAPAGINLAPMISKELTVHGSFRFSDEIDRAVALLDADPGIEQVVTHELPADQVVEAFGVARDSQVSGKVLVTL